MMIVDYSGPLPCHSNFSAFGASLRSLLFGLAATAPLGCRWIVLKLSFAVRVRKWVRNEVVSCRRRKQIDQV